MKKKYIVNLTEAEEKEFLQMLKRGDLKASIRNRVQILLLSNQGKTDKEIAEAVFMNCRTIGNIRRRYVENGKEETLKDKPRSGRPKTYTTNHEAELTAIACSDSPEGSGTWTLELLQEEMKEKDGCEKIAKNTIRLMLKKMKQNHGQKRCGALES